MSNTCCWYYILFLTNTVSTHNTEHRRYLELVWLLVNQVYQRVFMTGGLCVHSFLYSGMYIVCAYISSTMCLVVPITLLLDCYELLSITCDLSTHFNGFPAGSCIKGTITTKLKSKTCRCFDWLSSISIYVPLISRGLDIIVKFNCHYDVMVNVHTVTAKKTRITKTV